MERLRQLPWWNTPSTGATRPLGVNTLPQSPFFGEVRQRDLAGNQGSASTAFAYTYPAELPG